MNWVPANPQRSELPPPPSFRGFQPRTALSSAPQPYGGELPGLFSPTQLERPARAGLLFLAFSVLLTWLIMVSMAARGVAWYFCLAELLLGALISLSLLFLLSWLEDRRASRES